MFDGCPAIVPSYQTPDSKEEHYKHTPNASHLTEDGTPKNSSESKIRNCCDTRWSDCPYNYILSYTTEEYSVINQSLCMYAFKCV
jgi:hypothetical protein